MRLFENAVLSGDFLNRTMSVDEFITNSMAAAKHDCDKFPFQPTLKALN
jgi:hypothetical protein